MSRFDAESAPPSYISVDDIGERRPVVIHSCQETLRGDSFDQNPEVVDHVRTGSDTDADIDEGVAMPDTAVPSVVDDDDDNNNNDDAATNKSLRDSPGKQEEEGGIAKEEGEEPFPVYHGLRLYITVVGVILAMFPATLDETIIATSMNVIASEFNSQADVTWLATSYLLTMTAFSPIYGKLSDIFGLRLTMLTSIFTFMVASLLGALSPGMVYLIVFRAISGVAAAGLTSLALIAISKITPEESRGKYLGYLGVLYAVTGVLGPVIGGILTDKASWRWNFYLNIPLCVVAFAIIYFVLRVPVPRGSYWSKLKRVDYVGIVLFIGAVVIFLLALQWGGKDYAWDSATIIGLLVGSAALMAIFIWYELRWTPEPTFELHLAKVRNVWVSCLLGFTIGWVLLVIIYYIPLYYQYVHQYTAMPAGLQLLPFLIPLNVIAIAAGFITERWGCYKLVSVLGLALSALGTGLFYLISAEVSVAVVGVALGFAGLGVGLSIQMSIIPAQQQVGFALISQVTSFISFTRLIGGVFGISVVGAIINNTLESQAQTIMGHERPAEELLNILSYPLTVDTPTYLQVRESYITAIRLALFITFVPSILGFFVALAFKTIRTREDPEKV